MFNKKLKKVITDLILKVKELEERIEYLEDCKVEEEEKPKYFNEGAI